MLDITDNITTMFPHLLERSTWIAWLFGILCSAIGEKISNRFASDKYDWKLLSRLTYIDISLSIILLITRADILWYAILLLPLLYVPTRILVLSWKKKQMAAKVNNGNEADIVRYEYLLWLEKRSLLSYEVKHYLLPAMNILFEIGAIKHLDDRLSSLKKQYGDLYEWKKLKSFVHHNRHEYKEMLDLLLSVEKEKKLSKGERNQTVLNIFCAYRNLENEEGVNTYIRKIEQMVFDRNEYMIEALEDLLYHYEVNNNIESITKVLQIADNVKTKDFFSYMEMQDLRYMHNKRTGRRLENIKMLDQMMEKHNKMTEDNEEKLRFGLRMLKLYFENNYGWQEISLMMFSRAEAYLTHSRKIAIEYMEAVMLVLNNAQSMYNVSLPPERLSELFSLIVKHISKYMPDYDKEITNLPDDFVYRKKEMLMHKVTYARVIGNIHYNEPAYLREMYRLERQIIELCKNNGEEREMLHFLVVLTDDIWAFYDTIDQDIANGISDANILKSIEDRPVYMKNIKQNINEIESIISRYNYNRTLAYYIFYLAYFQFRIGNMEDARFALHKYNETEIPITNFTLAVQKLYHQLLEELKLNS